MNSYHIFYFPFKWNIPGLSEELFSVQSDLGNIQFDSLSAWEEGNNCISSEEADELYNEKNYFYEFVHPVLYADGRNKGVTRHFERKEPRNGTVSYTICHAGRRYCLKVDAIKLNLYSTGVGTLSFHLRNEGEDQKEPEDILTINQYGRRIMPPFIGDKDIRSEIADYIELSGLYCAHRTMREDFSSYTNSDFWKPSEVIIGLIKELDSNLCIKPVIDDRMFVLCWYGNDDIANKLNKYDLNDKQSLSLAEDRQNCLSEDDFWYKYVFIDVVSATCTDDILKCELLRNSTYTRWKGYGTLFGVSRYSFVILSDKGDFACNMLSVHLRTMYSRMVELTLVQRASVLRFSDEVVRLNQRAVDSAKVFAPKVGALYKEFIRFMNQIYFKEVTAQDQGIDLYHLLHANLCLPEFVNDLDNDIEELHSYVMLLVDSERNVKAEYLNKIATFFLPATVITGFWGMNKVDSLIDGGTSIVWQSLMIVIITILVYNIALKNKGNDHKGRK